MPLLKVLLMAANPFDTSRLSLDEEVRSIEHRLRATRNSDSIQLIVKWAARPDDLLQALNEEDPQIVHFSGHGNGASGLAFHGEDGNAQLVSGPALEATFSVLKNEIRVVLLNACYSREQATSIASCIDCVIGMNSSIADKAAIKFASAFYRAIGFGRSVQNAYEQGIASIALENLEQENVPKIIIRDGVDARKIYLCERNVKEKSKNREKTSDASIISVRKEVPNKRLQKKYGRKFLDSTLPRLATNIRFNQKISLIMLDVDDLTIINKQYSKSAGNEVIASVTRIIYSESGVEHSGRCGDDTFFVLLASFGLSEATDLAEHLRVCVERHPWASIAKEMHVTCTFGVSQLKKREPIREWIVRAAIGMTEGKKTGVELHEMQPERLPEAEAMSKLAHKKPEHKIIKRKGRKNIVNAGPSFLGATQSRDYRDYFS